MKQIIRNTSALLLIYTFSLFLNFVSAATPLAPKPKEQPNIVWITSEDNSMHYMKLFNANGIETPNIESLAEHGLIFTHAFSNAPVCSAARSTLISGCYGPRLASHYHRQLQKTNMPEGVEMFPAYLRQAGYYTSNNPKEDYNINKTQGVWDESSNKASWKNRKEGQPFFHVSNFETTHESRLHFSEEQMIGKATTTNPESVFVQPNHPQSPLFKYTNAYYRDQIAALDKQVGAVVDELKKDGLLESTFIFYFGDHGGVLPGSKGYIYETGLHVPLVIHIPEKYKHLVNAAQNSSVTGFVSFIDFGATVLHLAGIDIPKGMHGTPFLGKNISKKQMNNRDETYSYADRFDEKSDMVRAVRKGNFKYIRNFQPFYFDGLYNEYRYKQLAYQEWLSMYKNGKLNRTQSAFFEAREPEMLFDVEADPYETNNLTSNPAYASKLKEMRNKLFEWSKQMPDLSFFPESYLITHAMKNPVAFGQAHKDDILNYMHIANLSLLHFTDAKAKLGKSLQSDDPFSRYWGFITCSSFGEEATQFAPIAKQVAHNDINMLVRMRAAEFLAIIKAEDPSEAVAKALSQSKEVAEALLILNSVVFLNDGNCKANIHIQEQSVTPQVLKDKMVVQRIKYINQEL